MDDELRRHLGALLTPEQLEERAHLAGLSLAEVCRRANVAQSTFTRWKAGLSEPRLGVYRRLLLATEHTALPDTPVSAMEKALLKRVTHLEARLSKLENGGHK